MICAVGLREIVFDVGGVGGDDALDVARAAQEDGVGGREGEEVPLPVKDVVPVLEELREEAIEGVALETFNQTADATLFPEFDVIVRAEVRIRYGGGNFVVVSHSGVDLCQVTWLSFYRGMWNMTLIRTMLMASGIHLSALMRRDLVAGQGRRVVPLEVRARVPVRVKFGAVKTWMITAKVRCDLMVDKLVTSLRVVLALCGVVDTGKKNICGDDQAVSLFKQSIR
ncbi:hypothetical protein Taro_024651 [Colocasia esculenta]|uniref:Uncharacterized protein n=1 Tax=Colocasia esculenta TaxID=4460 RepID=A0A843VF55_COLES|nr:hypothetical protein [Colocasia esculenta]